MIRNYDLHLVALALLAGLSYCFFSIDALGSGSSSSTIRFEPIEQKIIAGHKQ